MDTKPIFQHIKDCSAITRYGHSDQDFFFFILKSKLLSVAMRSFDEADA